MAETRRFYYVSTGTKEPVRVRADRHEEVGTRRFGRALKLFIGDEQVGEFQGFTQWYFVDEEQRREGLLLG